MVGSNEAAAFPSPRRRAIHICIGQAKDYKEPLIQIAREGASIVWTINKLARVCDLVLFYMNGDMEIVARGRVAALWDDETTGERWSGRRMAEVDELELFARPISRAKLRARFPDWGFWFQPQRSQRVPDVYAKVVSAFFELPVEAVTTSVN
jgi:hypothetical protein